MNRPKPLFIIGNKRSGTSQLVRFLNLNPQIFVTHESDIVWILYQMMKNEIPQCYPWDGPIGMEATLKTCKDILEKNKNNLIKEGGIDQIFYQVGYYLMRNGADVKNTDNKTDLVWIGDKKPVQQADPVLRNFIHTYFPDARFIHIIRHPQAVVASMVEAGKSWAHVALLERISEYHTGTVGYS